MSFRRLGALFAALTIAGFPLAAQSADAPPPVPGMTGDVIDAQAQIDALKDIPSNSWAYQSIMDLVNDGIIVGYPDGTFKGNRPLTRYEAAVMVERAVAYLTKKLANPQTASDVSPKDIDALRALLDAFRGDIIALRLRVDDIDTRLKTVETTQKNDEAAANRARLGAVYYVRAGSLNESTAAFTNAFPTGAPGCAAAGLSPCGGALALPAGTPLTGGNPGANSGNQGNSNKYLAGANTQGYGYQLLRLLLDGTLDPSLSYHIRLENRLFWSAPSAQLGSIANFPGGTVAATPSLTGIGTVNGYPANTTVRLNYAYAQYQDATSGLGAAVGRLNDTDGTLGLLFADQWNGASVGYNKYGLNLRASYGFTWPQYDSTANNNPLTQPTPGSACTAAVSGVGTTFTNKCSGFQTQVLAAQASYAVNKKLTVGAAYVDDINDQILDWNTNVCSLTGTVPSATGAHAGACQQYTGGTFIIPTAANGYAGAGAFTAPYVNLAEGSLFGRYADQIAKIPFVLEAEGSYRFGNDPNTGTNWKQPLAVWVQGKIGWYNPTPYRPYLEAGYIGAGYNSLSPHTALTNGTSYDIQYQGNANGYALGYVGLHYWFSRYGRIGVIYQASDILNGTTIPVASGTYASTYLTHDISNGVFLQTWLQF
jgi:S-layer homology domain